MADPMQRPPQGQPQTEQIANPIEQNRSVFNPTDLAAMKQEGRIGKDMTTRDFIEGVLKVPMDAPVQQLIQALRGQSQNATPMGKVKSMSQASPGQAPQRQPRGRGLEGLMSMGGE